LELLCVDTGKNEARDETKKHARRFFPMPSLTVAPGGHVPFFGWVAEDDVRSVSRLAALFRLGQLAVLLCLLLLVLVPILLYPHSSAAAADCGKGDNGTPPPWTLRRLLWAFWGVSAITAAASFALDCLLYV
jgi:hypothetical protein